MLFRSVDDQIQNLQKRLDESAALQSNAAKIESTEGSAAGLAFKAVTELFVGLAVCMVAGYFIDRYLGSAPWIMIGLMPVGLAAGVVNVLRLSNSKQAKEVLGEGGPIPPSVKDDDED